MAKKATSILGQEKNIRFIDVAVKKSMPVLLIGETGSGKTTMVKEQAHKNKRKVLRFNLTGETTVDEFIGKYILEEKKTVWQDGILLTAMKEGHWLVVDEVNVALPEILFVLHSLLDDDRAVTVTSHESEVVTPHEDFRFFATMNPVEEYSGTKDLNKAFLSRFPMILHVDYPDQATEIKVLRQETEIGEKEATMISEVAVLLRRSKKANEIFYTCSTRDLIQWALLTPEIGLGSAFEVTIASKAKADEKRIVEIVNKVMEVAEKIHKGHGITCLEDINRRAEELALERRRFTEEKGQIRNNIIKEMVEKFAEAGVLK